MTTTKREVTVREIAEKVEKTGYRLLKERPLTTHPDDWYLKVVLAYNDEMDSYCIWLYNATDKGLYEGYHTLSNEVASIKYYNKK